MSCDQALDKLSEKLYSRLLVQEEHGFQKGAQCAPLAAGAQKKPGLDRVKGGDIVREDIRKQCEWGRHWQ